MKKKVIVLGLVLTLLCGMTACGTADKTSDSGSMAGTESTKEGLVGDVIDGAGEAVQDAVDGVTDAIENMTEGTN